MKLLTNFKSIEEDFGLIIGNFDGVHLGHRNLLEDFVNNCRSKSLAPVLLTFNPHPRFYFVPDTTDFKINDSARKSDLLAQCNLKYLIELPFDQSIQQLEAREFLENFIFCYPNLKLMAIGHDFAMGAGKEDSRKLVKQLCELKNVTLTEAKSHSFKNEIVSSSMIRKLIKQGQVKEANEFLARDFSLTGTVVKGQGIGSKKLVPTINTEFDYSQLLPKNGVYITRVKVNGKYFNSTTNIGVRPTVSKDDIRKLETFIFDFNEDIYGAEVSIIFLERLREEVKFDSLEDLKKQIDADVERAKKYFKTDTTPHLHLWDVI